MKLLVVISLLFPVLCNAQSYNWANNFGGTGSDSAFANKVDVDQLGGVYTVGVYKGTCTFPTATLPSTTALNGFVAKHDTAGTNLWVRSFHSPSTIAATSISTDRAGNSYITGYFTDSLFIGTDTLLPGSGNLTMYAAKFDAFGNYRWAVSGAGTGTSQGWGIATDEHYLYITGSCTGNTTYSGIPVTGNTSGVLLAKYDTAGVAQWATAFANTATDNYGYTIKSDTLNIYIGGTFANTISFGTNNLTSSSGANPDGFVVKLDSAGNDAWAQNIAGTGWWDGVFDVATDGTGNVYATGYFYGNCAIGSNLLVSNGGGTDYDAFACKYNAAGAVQWAINAGGSLTDFGYGIEASESDKCYIAGKFENSITLGTLNDFASGGTDVYIAFVDDSGTPQWLETAGGLQNDELFDLTLGNYNELYIVGDHRGPSATFGTNVLTVNGEVDGYLARFDLPVPQLSFAITNETVGSDGAIDLTVTGGASPLTYDWNNDGTGDFDDAQDLAGLVADWYTVTIMDSYGCTFTDSVEVENAMSIGDINISSVQIYPNPAAQELTIVVSGNAIGNEAKIINSIGKTVWRGTLSNYTIIDLSMVPAGIYMFHQEDTHTEVKLIKQ